MDEREDAGEREGKEREKIDSERRKCDREAERNLRGEE